MVDNIPQVINSKFYIYIIIVQYYFSIYRSVTWSSGLSHALIWCK